MTEATDRGARGSPGRGGRGTGGDSDAVPAPSSAPPARPSVPRQAAQDSSVPKLGAPAAHGASASPGFTAGCVCMGVTSSSRRMAATFGGGQPWPRPSRDWSLQLQKLPRRVSVALLPSLHGATPTSPRGNHSRAPLLPQATGFLCQHFVMVPKHSREDNPRRSGCHGALSCQHCRDAQILPACVLKHEAVLLKAVIWAALVPQGTRQAWGRAAGLCFPLG